MKVKKAISSLTSSIFSGSSLKKSIDDYSEDEQSLNSGSDEDNYVPQKSIPMKMEQKPTMKKKKEVESVQRNVKNIVSALQSQNVLKRGTVHICVNEFLQLLQHYHDQETREQQQQFLERQSHKFLIKELQLKGTARKESVAITATYDVEILDFEKISGLSEEEIPFNESRWVYTVLLTNVCRKVVLQSARVVPLTESASPAPSSASSDAEPEESEAHYIGIKDNNIAMLSNRPGKYRVELELSVPYDGDKLSLDETNNNRQLNIGIPKALKSSLLLTILARDDIQVKVTPALYSNVTKEEAKVKIFDENNEQSFKRHIVDCTFPAAENLSVQWNPAATLQPTELLLQGLEAEKEEKLPLMITADQNSLHAFGEGMIQTTCFVNYSISNGSVTQVSASINSHGRPIRIIGVFGSAIKNWEVVEKQDEDSSTKIKVLTVDFSYGIENSCELEIHTELDMGGTSALTAIPTFSCLNVTREKGSMAIVARTSIEIKEESRKYLGKLDVSELPQQIRSFSQFPILYAYKYIEQGYQLKMNVTRHDDIPVLSSIIQHLSYDIALGMNNYQHTLNIQLLTTSKQFLRIQYPQKNCELWSVLVNGSSVKPAQEEKENKKHILVPLTSCNKGTLAIIQTIFVQPSKPMRSSGTLSFELAKFDCPIQRLRLSLYLAEEYDYGEFEGNIEEKKEQMQAVLHSRKSSNGLLGGLLGGKRQNARILQQSARMDDVCLEREVAEKRAGFLSGVKSISLGSGYTTQCQFEFDKYLLLENSAVSCKVNYVERKKPFWLKRRTSPFIFKALNFVFMLLIISLMVLVILLYLKQIYSKQQQQ